MRCVPLGCARARSFRSRASAAAHRDLALSFVLGRMPQRGSPLATGAGVRLGDTSDVDGSEGALRSLFLHNSVCPTQRHLPSPFRKTEVSLRAMLAHASSSPKTPATDSALTAFAAHAHAILSPAYTASLVEDWSSDTCPGCPAVQQFSPAVLVPLLIMGTVS